MTTPSTPRKAGPLLGTGAQTSWPFTFKVFAASDIAVTIANNLGVETALVLGTDYSVSVNANQDTSPGGTVTYPLSGSPLPVGSKLTIIGNLPYDQPLDLPSGGNFSPLALENELDRLTMQIQQLREQVGRAIQVSVTTGANVGLPAPSANELIGWDSTGNNLQNFGLSELATAVAYATMRYDTFTGNGTTTQFTLTADPVTLANLDVAISGVTQVPGSDYSLVNGVLVFASAPANGTEILARYGEGLVNVGGDSNDIRFLQAGVGVVQRTVQDELRLHVNVKQFGAVGDGVANDTAAFSAALATGKSVFIPDGTYLITSSLTVSTGGQAIFGEGWQKSIVRRGNDSSFVIFNVTAPWGVEFLNFKIEEPSLSYTNTGSFIQLAINGGTDVLIQGMWLWYGWQHVRCMQGTSNITFSNTVFEAARKGAIYSHSSARNKIVGCTFWKNSADISNPADRGYAVNLTKDGAYSFGSDNWNIVGNYFAENVYGPFLLANTSEGVQVTGNFFEIASQVDNGQKSDIELTSCTRWSIDANTSDSIVNSYTPGARGSKYVVDLSGGGNTQIAIIGNGFEAGVSGTINDPLRVADTAGAYPISWSMPLQINSSGTGITMSAQVATATRVGKLETLVSSTTLTSKGASTGAVRLGPLPHTPTAISFGSGYISNSSGITTPIYFQFNTDGYVYPLYGVSTNVADTNIANDSVVVFSGTYPIA